MVPSFKHDLTDTDHVWQLNQMVGNLFEVLLMSRAKAQADTRPVTNASRQSLYAPQDRIDTDDFQSVCLLRVLPVDPFTPIPLKPV